MTLHGLGLRPLAARPPTLHSRPPTLRSMPLPVRFWPMTLHGLSLDLLRPRPPTLQSRPPTLQSLPLLVRIWPLTFPAKVSGRSWPHCERPALSFHMAFAHGVCHRRLRKQHEQQQTRDDQKLFATSVMGHTSCVGNDSSSGSLIRFRPLRSSPSWKSAEVASS